MLSLILAAALMDAIATPVVLPSEPAPLHGTLLTPDGPTHAVAVILPGSGPTDRDGNMATYLDPALPLAPGVVDDVASFILEDR